MEIDVGCFYFIKDSFFDIIDDPELMKNKENGNKRPCYYCFKSEKYDDIIWFVPVSTKVEKYQKIYNKKIEKQIKLGKNPSIDTIVFGNIANTYSVFLIQNMFPVTLEYIECPYIKNKVVIRVSNKLKNFKREICIMEKQTAGRDNLGELAPKFAELNDDVLFGEVWSREDKMSLRDRSMITISALMAQGLFPQLKSHFIIGKKHGITKQEAVEIVTQLAFYAGWPKVWSAFALIKEVYGDEEKPEEHGGVFGLGEPNVNFAQYFVGNSYLKPLTNPKETVFMANVTFEPRCRNNWHIHHATSGGGQILICVDGEGWYQEEGKEARRLKPGDIVTIPANVKHWHGATANSWFSHIAVEIPGENTSNEWCEKVTDEEYDKLK